MRIGLTYKLTPFVDGVGNSHKLRGSFWREKSVLGVVIPIEHLMEDVFFVFDSEGIEQDLIFTDGFESGDGSRWSESCEGLCP